jgi:hypothetical protein
MKVSMFVTLFNIMLELLARGERNERIQIRTEEDKQSLFEDDKIL